MSALALAAVARAHGFGERYDLPVPLWLYLTGAGAAVGVSFLMMALFMRGSPPPATYPRIDLLVSLWIIAQPIVTSRLG